MSLPGVNPSREQREAEYYALLRAEDYLNSSRSLAHYVRASWHVLEPGTPFIDGWHVDLVCEYLQAVKMSQISKLVINMRFRSIKSIAGSICLPTWWWTDSPETRFICASHAGELATEFNTTRRDLIKSAWYQAAWANKFHLDLDDRKQFFRNSMRGSMFATSVGGSVVGKGGDVLLIDDPNDPKNPSEHKLDSAAVWYDRTFSNRKNQSNSKEILIMQRIGVKDLTAHVLEKDGWTHLNVPWEAKTKTIIVMPVSKTKIVREKGSFMDPERFNPKIFKQEWKKNLGPYGYSAQVEQDPTPIQGKYFLREWWKRYGALPRDIIRVRMYADCAEQPGSSNDYSVFAVIAETPTGFYWLYVWRKQVKWPELENAAKDLWAHFSSVTNGLMDKFLIEKKSAGTQLLQALQHDTKIPVEAFNPGQRDKVVRAASALPTVASGNCYLPLVPNELTPDTDWVEDFISEHEKFSPTCDYDDQVDTTSMGLEDLRYDNDEVRVTVL